MILAACLILAAQPATAMWTVDCNQPTVNLSPTLFGAFFEEINHAGDGGLYGELLPNRLFSYGDTPAPWEVEGPADPVKVVHEAGQRGLDFTVLSGTPFELQNPGYWGVPAIAGKPLVVRLKGTGPNAALVQARIIDRSGASIAECPVGFTKGEAEAILVPAKTDPASKFSLVFATPGHYRLTMASLFPRETWKGRSNGLRKDLASEIAALAPSFVRFPGGCWVEGNELAMSYRWKNTIGPLDGRATVQDLWGYKSDNGLGYLEYLEMCEDLDATPLFVVNAGMSHHQFVPVDQLGPWVQDALDAVEFANGPVTSKWGSVRAKEGHPRPFRLQYVEIGNENGLFGSEFGGSVRQYKERYDVFYPALHAKYPKLRLIADCRPPGSPLDIVDEHYYNSAGWFVDHANQYDAYPRTGPKIYVGEYAVTTGVGDGSLHGALAEAAFMTGLERNSDLVEMASYAPLLSNMRGRAWSPDLIYYDDSRTEPSPSYWAQYLFSNYRPTSELRNELVGVRPVERNFQAGGIGVGTWHTQAEFKNIKLEEGGQTIYQSADGQELKHERGNWTVKDGALLQTGDEDGTRAWIGNDWDRYTLTVQARKDSGDEGFLITMGRVSDDTWIWWNVGGWGNTRSALEQSIQGDKEEVGRPAATHLENGRWYDVKIEYSPDRIRCYLDGKLMEDESTPSYNPVYVTAGRCRADGSVILKLVNLSSQPQPVSIDLRDSGFDRVSAVGEVLTGPSLNARNSLDQPNEVSPRKVRIKAASSRFDYTFPPNSLTVLKIRGSGG